MKINLFPSVFLHTNPQEICPFEWFDMIKSDAYLDTILDIRSKPTKNEYDKDKCSKLPAVCWNGFFEGTRENASFLRPSGFLYIDIDKPDFDPSVLDTDKVFAYYKSISNLGYAVIVKAENITLESYVSTYNHVLEDLKLENDFDINARKFSQCNVLPYDTELFVNKDSYTYKAILPDTILPPNHTNNNIISIINKKDIKTTGGQNKLIFSNLEFEYSFDGVVVDWSGMEEVCCYIPFNKNPKVRNSVMLSYCRNLLYLNQWLDKDSCKKILYAVNKKMFLKPLPTDRIPKIVNSLFKQLDSGKLTPFVSPKSRKMYFQSDCGLDTLGKRKRVIEELSARKTDLSLQKIESILESWDLDKFGKITMRRMVANNPISKKTVEKYWYLFKKDIEEVNNSWKLSK